MNSDLQPQDWKKDPEHGSAQLINGQADIKEALGFLKDWVTSLVAIQTAAIGAIAVLLKVEDQPAKGAAVIAIGRHPRIEFVLVCVSLLCFLVSIFYGCFLLNMLPGCAQRKRAERTEDIYSLKTIGKRNLAYWTRGFRSAFIVGLAAFALFIVVHTWPDF